ncbi:hypothetical protein B0I37DRAFT_166055 [Chaetomium sp. MPI-CAGE-AT-0009]|nr:hypothetical protein B0I37DRAFT_166055 [Chaetomium sp. MPI-CAGE-AT-0009]
MQVSCGLFLELANASWAHTPFVYRRGHCVICTHTSVAVCPRVATTLRVRISGAKAGETRRVIISLHLRFLKCPSFPNRCHPSSHLLSPLPCYCHNLYSCGLDCGSIIDPIFLAQNRIHTTLTPPCVGLTTNLLRIVLHPRNTNTSDKASVKPAKLQVSGASR